MHKLRQEELDLLVTEAPQLVAEHMADADMLGIAPVVAEEPASAFMTLRRRDGVNTNARKVGDGQRGVLVEVVGLDEPFEQIPAHGG